MLTSGTTGLSAAHTDSELIEPTLGPVSRGLVLGDLIRW
jgi:hypothetical protein